MGDGWDAHDTVRMRTALTIAGSDCSGGAGVQADLKTFAAHGVYGMSVIVSVVAENTSRVIALGDVSPELIEQQINAVFEDIPVDAVKVGMLSSVECMDAVVAGLARWRPKHVVIDPVMYAKGGAPLMARDAVEHFKRAVLPWATVLTPNIPEARELSGIAVLTSEDQLKAARAIARLAEENARFVGGQRVGLLREPIAVLLKGGHRMADAGTADTESDPSSAVDVLWDGRTSTATAFAAPRFDTPNTHGTGCTLSSAIAANLARGDEVPKAVAQAKAYVTGAIAHALPLGEGHGPTHHLYYVYQHGLSGTGPLPDDLPTVTVTPMATDNPVSQRVTGEE